MFLHVTDGLVLLHLSDIHFHRASGGVYDAPDVDLRNEIERDIEGLRKQVRHIDHILVTGDIAFSGKSAEYVHASNWLARLCILCGIPEEAVFVTPGNHDVDRDVVKKIRALRDLRTNLRKNEDEAQSARELDAALQDNEGYGPLLFKPLEHYQTFAGPYGCMTSALQPYWEADLLLNDGSTLRLRGLNSVLLSDDRDNNREHRLLIGAAALVLTRQPGVEHLTLCHHPPDWLFDADSVRDRLNHRARIQLYGHRHQQRIHRHNGSLIITAGAVHPDRREGTYEPRYNLLRLQVETVGVHRTLLVEVWPRRYSSDRQQFQPDYDPEGRDRQEFRMELSPWTKPVAGATIGWHEPLVPSAGVTDPPPLMAVGTRSAMTPLRRLTYRFLSLSFTSRLLVAQELGLVEESDEGLQDVDRFRLVLLRAKERGQLPALWDAVEKRHADRSDVPNPFTA